VKIQAGPLGQVPSAQPYVRTHAPIVRTLNKCVRLSLLVRLDAAMVLLALLFRKDFVVDRDLLGFPRRKRLQHHRQSLRSSEWSPMKLKSVITNTPCYCWVPGFLLRTGTRMHYYGESSAMVGCKRDPRKKK
jgi:hypothetical protein